MPSMAAEPKTHRELLKVDRPGHPRTAKSMHLSEVPLLQFSKSYSWSGVVSESNIMVQAAWCICGTSTQSLC